MVDFLYHVSRLDLGRFFDFVRVEVAQTKHTLTIGLLTPLRLAGLMIGFF